MLWLTRPLDMNIRIGTTKIFVRNFSEGRVTLGVVRGRGKERLALLLLDTDYWLSTEEALIIFLGVRKGEVKLGIEAPPNVMVDREEIYQRKIAERREEKRSRKKAAKPQAKKS